MPRRSARRKLRGADVHAAVDLHRVGVDDLAAEPLCQVQRELGLARRRRADDRDDRRLSWSESVAKGRIGYVDQMSDAAQDQPTGPENPRGPGGPDAPAPPGGPQRNDTAQGESTPVAAKPGHASGAGDPPGKRRGALPHARGDVRRRDPRAHPGRAGQRGAPGGERRDLPRPALGRADRRFQGVPGSRLPASRLAALSSDSTMLSIAFAPPPCQPRAVSRSLDRHPPDRPSETIVR